MKLKYLTWKNFENRKGDGNGGGLVVVWRSPFELFLDAIALRSPPKLNAYTQFHSQTIKLCNYRNNKKINTLKDNKNQNFEQN